MANSAEQKRIKELESALEVAMYWLLRAESAVPDHSILDRTRSLKTSLDMFLRNHGVKPWCRTTTSSGPPGCLLSPRPRHPHRSGHEHTETTRNTSAVRYR